MLCMDKYIYVNVCERLYHQLEMYDWTKNFFAGGYVIVIEKYQFNLYSIVFCENVSGRMHYNDDDDDDDNL